MLGGALAGLSPWAALAEAVGSLVAAGLARQYLQSHGHYDRDHPNLHVVRHLLVGGCGLGAAAGALFTGSLLLLSGELPLQHWILHSVEWWMGTSLGMLLVGPLALSYRRALRFPQPTHRVQEGLAVWLAAGIAGVLIFGNPPNDHVAAIANAY